MVGQALITVDDTEVVLLSPRSIRDVLGAIRAADVMTREVASVTSNVSARQVVDLLVGKNYRAVPVVESGVPVGIITNSDLVTRAGLGLRLELLAKADLEEHIAELLGPTLNEKTAGDIMTRKLVTVNPNTPLTEVAAIMGLRRLKRLPVADVQGKLVGMVSRFDLLRKVGGGFETKESEVPKSALAGNVPISQVMRSDMPTVHPDTPLPEVFQAVISTRLNRAIVVGAQRRVVGIVTDAELLDRVTPALRPSAIRSLMHRLPFVHPNPEELAVETHARARVAGDLMSTNIPTATENILLPEAISTMLRGNHKLLAVVNQEQQFVGVIDRADLLRGLNQPRR